MFQVLNCNNFAGVGIRPLNRDSRIDSNMFVLKYSDSNDLPTTADGEGDLNVDYAKRAEKFMEIYGTAAKDYETFDTAELGPCGTFPYGYIGDAVAPCVFLKFNKIWGWNPVPINETDFANNDWPANFKAHWDGQKGAQNKIWVDCQGRNAADKEALSSMQYYPSTRGFETKYFPYEGRKEEYHSPLVAVQFNFADNQQFLGQLINVECRAYYQGVVHETKSKAGLVQFELLVTK